MSVLALLIIASLLMGTAFLVGFIWAVRSGQYEDTCTPSMRMLVDDPPPHRTRKNFPTKQDTENP